jgi:RHH-type rel operon transcriptional repressor/antitoxin RelB
MPISIRLDADIEQRIDQLAKDTKRSKAFYLRELITNGLEDLEDYYRASMVSARIRNGTEKVYSEAQVRESLGLGA